VARCREWAVAEIARREASGRPVEEWTSYVRFSEHTLHELDAGTLDEWFDPDRMTPGRRP
jgi:hypothetical protein